MPPQPPKSSMLSARSTFTGDRPDIDKENAALQAHFEEEMQEKPQSHKKVAVLMLSWKKEGPEDLDTAEEVEQLSEVFEKLYKFKVHREEIALARQALPSQQINMFLAKFVVDEDARDTLLIIYYAGHGIYNSQKDGFVLAGGNPASPNQSNQRDRDAREIVWHEAEALINHARANMLLIFDCCHAGAVDSAKPRTRDFSNRIFEFLGACQANELTMEPGEESFTKALIWALTELSSHPDGFTTTMLYSKVFDAKNLPRTQNPYFNDKRGFHSLKRLHITPTREDMGPTETQEATTTGHSAKQAAYFLHLSLLFPELPSKEDVSEICTHLRQITQHPSASSKAQVSLIRWRGLFTKDKLKGELLPTARQFFWKLRARVLERQLRDLSAKSLHASAFWQRSPQALATPTQNGHAVVMDGKMLAKKMPEERLESIERVIRERDKNSMIWRIIQFYDRYKVLLLLLLTFGLGYIWGEHREHLWYHSQIIAPWGILFGREAERER